MKKVLSRLFAIAPYARILDKFTHKEGKYFECFYFPIVENDEGDPYVDLFHPRTVTIQVTDEQYEKVGLYRHIEIDISCVSFSKKTMQS
jgi:hypothetical protein